jgi:hypothetical protein
MSCDRARKQALLARSLSLSVSGTLEMIDEGFLPRDPFPGLRQEAGYSATFALALFLPRFHWELLFRERV